MLYTGCYSRQLRQEFVKDGLPIMPPPFNLMWTDLNLIIDYIATAGMTTGGISTSIAALSRDGVTERTMYVALTVATEVAAMPRKVMLEKIEATVGKAAYDKCNAKLKRTCVCIFMKEVNNLISQMGSMATMQTTPGAMAKSFYCRLIDPVDGILATGKDPYLHGLEKEDMDTEREFLGGRDLSDCEITAGGNLRNMAGNWFQMILLAYASSVVREYENDPVQFNLDKLLYYDEEAEGAPHDESGMKRLRKKAPRVTVVDGTKMEHLVNTTGVIRTNENIDIHTPKLQSFIPIEHSLTNTIKKKLICDLPKIGFRPSVNFLRNNFLINGKTVKEPKTTTTKVSPVEKMTEKGKSIKGTMSTFMNSKIPEYKRKLGEEGRTMTRDQLIETAKNLIEDITGTLVHMERDNNESILIGQTMTKKRKIGEGKETSSTIEGAGKSDGNNAQEKPAAKKNKKNDANEGMGDPKRTN